MVHEEPIAVADFPWIELQGRPLVKGEEKGLYPERTRALSPGGLCRQDLLKIFRLEHDAGLFGGFPKTGGQQVWIAFFLSPSREGEMTRPGICRVCCPSQDEKTVPWLEGADNGDGCAGWRGWSGIHGR